MPAQHFYMAHLNRITSYNVCYTKLLRSVTGLELKVIAGYKLPEESFVCYAAELTVYSVSPPLTAINPRVSGPTGETLRSSRNNFV